MNEIVKKNDLSVSKTTYTPMKTDHYDIYPQNEQLNENVRYWNAMGALLYVSTVTKLAVSTCVNILGWRNEKLMETDWLAIENVIRYINTTKYYKFLFDKSKPPILTEYYDSD